MTKHKWYGEIGAWREGCEIEQFWAPLAKIPWAKVSSPQWDDPRLLFRIYDPHREIKEAMARGEVIEEVGANGIWRKASDWAASRGFKFQFTNSPDRYRIAPKPDAYQHLRNAIREGKRIEFYLDGAWKSIGTEDDHNPNRSFHLPPDQYRIAPKTDYVVSGAIHYYRDHLRSKTFVVVAVTIDGETGEAKSVELVK